MIFDIEINNKTYKAKRGETILATLERCGIKIPTLCYMQEFMPTGNCRICVVEVEDKETLITACSHLVEPGMKIQTHSPKVIKARKTNIELLLMNHPNDCLYCIRNGSCELQNLSIQLNITERKNSKIKKNLHIDRSSSSIVRDLSKCILCGRCIRICNEQQKIHAIDFVHRGNLTSVSPALNKPINLSSCINCGQCIMACPTASLTEKNEIQRVQDALYKENTYIISYYSSSITVSLAEEFGIKPGKDLNGSMSAALRKIGFSAVFDSGFSADLYIKELVAETQNRLSSNLPLPIFSSTCPSWIQYAEQNLPDLLPLISLCKSPQQMMGKLIKEYFSKEKNIPIENIFTVSIVPCTSKKYESQRDEMTTKGISDVDAVLTTRELASLIRLNGIDMDNIEPESTDDPFKIRSSAAKLFAITGGVTEAYLRTLHFDVTGKDAFNFKLEENINTKERKDGKFKIGKTSINVSVINGIGNINEIIEEIRSQRCDSHFIEVMACPGGCIKGGGQPLHADKKNIKARLKTIFDIDENEILKGAHKNPQIEELYDKFLKSPNSSIAKELLHTSYTYRSEIQL